MARGHARAPSQNAFRGTIGRTQTAVVHVTSPSGDLVPVTVHTAIDAVSDPELAARLQSDDPARALNVAGDRRLAMPIVYHDPAAELMVLVLDESHRHRELDERIRLLKKLRAEDAPIPAYAKDFAVVFGAAGLHAYLEGRANAALSQVSAARAQDAGKELERKQDELAKAQAELARGRQELAAARSLLEHERAEHQRAAAEAEKARVEKPRAPVVEMAPEATVIAHEPPRHDEAHHDEVRHDEAHHEESFVTAPIPKSAAEHEDEHEDDHEAEHEAEALPDVAEPKPNGVSKVPMAEFQDEATTGQAIIPQGADPLTTDTVDMGPPERDAWLDFAATGVASSFEVEGGQVRLALVVGEQIARGLRGVLDVRVLLHRLPTYPVITLVIGPPAALRVPSPTQLAVVTLDVGVDLDHKVLAALGKHFELTVVVIHRGVPMRQVKLGAPLADNVQYILRAAEDHLRGVAADGEPSYQKARDIVTGAGFDLLGGDHAESGEFRDDKLAQLATAQQLRRAIAIARRFARPSREDYLVCARGFPLQRWRDLRRHVLESAVAWGLWMGPELAQVAVSEGLARSRRDLVAKLDMAFEQLRAHPTAYDIDEDAAADNLKALAEEARSLGVELHRKVEGAIKSEDVPEVSGSIEGEAESLVSATTPDQLMVMLDDKRHRVTAAAELCDRGIGNAAPAVIAAVKKMSRAEAVRILGKSVKLGPAAAAPLIEGLQSSKAFLRHGCALALALLRTDEGTRAVIELLLAEPTEVWREIARALGQVGPGALAPLAAHIGRMGDRMTAQLAERVTWAMAHVGARGGRGALEQMAAGQSVMAPLAQQAVTLIDTAARDEVRVRPGAEASKDVTVNRAFSRRFFEALDASDVAQSAGLAGGFDVDVSAPMELLDDSDLIVDDEEDSEAELDEADLIQT
ncbi:MAG TPA: hypothetical protein VGL61_19355 [Kofleriaceae bacterium]|jgi:hypothetical protein